MLPQFIISFREVLEISILIGIATTYLSKMDVRYLTQYIWFGAFSGVAASALLGVGIWFLYGGLSEQYEKLFEACANILAAGILTTVIVFLANKGHHGLKEKLARVLERDTRIKIIVGVTLFGFLAVFREGVEIVLFLTPFLLHTPVATTASLVIGTLLAASIGFALYWIGMRIPLQRMFYSSNILLVLIASGVLGYGIHELLEYFALIDVSTGWLSTYAYNLNIPSDSIFSHKGLIGSLGATMVGYSTKMEWARVLSQLAYLLIFLPLVIPALRRKWNKNTD